MTSSLRQSDRWITPSVIVAGILTAGLVVLGIGAGMVYLTSIGRDPDPILRLLAQVVTAIGSVGTLVLQLTTRQTVAKTERNTGVLASETAALVDAVTYEGRHSYPDGYAPQTVEMGTAPAPTGR